jgi:hypothetical protein
MIIFVIEQRLLMLRGTMHIGINIMR